MSTEYDARPGRRSGPVPLTASAETAPSAMLAEGPTFARLVGFVGLFLLVLGAVVIISTRAARPAVGARGARASCSPRSAWR